jgi:hypothetical protein
MKTMKAVCTATVLALTLSVSAFAGDIATPGCARTGDTGTPGAVPTATAPISTEATAAISDLEMGTFADMFLALVSMF